VKDVNKRPAVRRASACPPLELTARWCPHALMTTSAGKVSLVHGLMTMYLVVDDPDTVPSGSFFCLSTKSRRPAPRRRTGSART
jgi:hypothetical protein